MKTYIGVDLGGTNVRVAKVDEAGAILQIVKEPTEIGKGVEQVVSKIISMIERIDGYQEVTGIGMPTSKYPINRLPDAMGILTMFPKSPVTRHRSIRNMQRCMNRYWPYSVTPNRGPN